MENETRKIQRSSNLIKAFMALIIVMQVVQFYQTKVLDFGAIAGSVGVLSMLRGLLLSPQLLVMPMSQWLAPTVVFAKESYKYFVLAFVLIIVSIF